VGSGFAEEFHLRWFWASEPAADVWVRSAASSLNGVSIAGPKSRQLVQRLVRDDLSPSAFKLFQVRETAVGFAPAILTRAGFTGELGYEIWTTPDYFASLYDDLWDAGRELGLVHFGGRALSSLRLEKAYGSFNKDFRPDYTPGETGLDRFVDFTKPDFTGRAAALAERAAGAQRRFVVMEVADADAEVVGYESIMKDGAAVGYVTSGAYGHCVGKSLAAGYVPSALAREARDSRSTSSARCELRQCIWSRSTIRRDCDCAASAEPSVRLRSCPATIAARQDAAGRDCTDSAPGCAA